MKYNLSKGKHSKRPQTRNMPSIRFRTMYRDLGLTRTSVAQLLRVSERTIHNWETGHHQVPYSAYKLVRLMTHQEFPNPAWAGWHMTAGVLYTPEGHGFKPQDSSWWSLLCRKAAMFEVLYAKTTHNSECSAFAAKALQAELQGEVPVTLHQSLTDETKPADVTNSAVSLRTQVTPHEMFTDERKTPEIRGLPCPAAQRNLRPHVAKTSTKEVAK